MMMTWETLTNSMSRVIPFLPNNILSEILHRSLCKCHPPLLVRWKTHLETHYN